MIKLSPIEGRIEIQRDLWKLLFKFVYNEIKQLFKRTDRRYKKNEEMIMVHQSADSSVLTIKQYEAVKARQISELIDGMPPYQTIESISVIKHILDKFYPELPQGMVTQKELKELEEAI